MNAWAVHHVLLNKKPQRNAKKDKRLGCVNSERTRRLDSRNPRIRLMSVPSKYGTCDTGFSESGLFFPLSTIGIEIRAEGPRSSIICLGCLAANDSMEGMGHPPARLSSEELVHF